MSEATINIMLADGELVGDVFLLAGVALSLVLLALTSRRIK